MQLCDSVDDGGEFILLWGAGATGMEGEVCEQWKEERGKFVERGFGALAAVGSTGGAGAAEAAGFEAIGDVVKELFGVGCWQGWELVGIVI